MPREPESPQTGPSRPRGLGGSYSSAMGEAGPHLFIGIQIAASMAMFVLGGYFADAWLNTSPWLLILGAVLGMVAMVALVIKAASELDQKQAARRKRQ